MLVDVLSPDFNDADAVAKMLECVATSIAQRVKVDRTNIFINHRHAHSGMVFDAGRVERW